MRPYRTDDFITKLYYESSRFSAFNLQWVVKARVNDSEKDPTHTVNRKMTLQLVLKSKAQNPIHIQYFALPGPYSEIKMRPKVYRFEFSSDATETSHQDLPLVCPMECNKILAGRNINMRLIFCQVPK